MIQPPQLSRLLDWLAQASLSILIRPQAAGPQEAAASGPSIILRRPSSNQPAAQPAQPKKENIMDWLVTLQADCEPLDGVEASTLR